MTGALSMAERSYLTSEIRGSSGEDPMPEGRWPRGATPHLRSGVAAGRSNPTSKEQWLARVQEGLEELSHVEGQEGRQ